ncbi:hypothetical protein [Streptomyces sp. f150]|uniref:hypothetical protein n=1 Tax=Streptomyces sp. f150 TaxID=1827699 RepID=UPI001180D80C|nr:hypothetical protein [Streptomyces sp. f150]
MPTTPDRPAESILGPITPIRCTEPGCHWACHGVPDKYADSRARIVREHMAAEHAPTPESPDRPADQLHDRAAAAIWARYPDAEPSRTGLVMGNPHALADAALSTLPAPALAVARQLLGTSTGEDTAAVAPSADRRDRYAAAMALRDGHPEWPARYEDDERNYRRRADAAMAVADAEVVQAMRAMHDTKEEEREAHRLALSEALGLGTGAPWDAIRDRAAELAAAAPPAPADRAAFEALAAEFIEKRGEYGDSSITDRARELRAVLAGEAAAGAHQTEQAHRSYRLEHRRPGDTTWQRNTPGIGANWSWESREKADQRLTEARTRWPDFEYRLIETTTTVTEAPAVPAAPEETR